MARLKAADTWHFSEQPTVTVELTTKVTKVTAEVEIRTPDGSVVGTTKVDLTPKD